MVSMVRKHGAHLFAICALLLIITICTITTAIPLAAGDLVFRTGDNDALEILYLSPLNNIDNIDANLIVNFRLDFDNYPLTTRTWPYTPDKLTNKGPTGPVLFEFGGAGVKPFSASNTCTLSVCSNSLCAYAYPLDIGTYLVEGSEDMEEMARNRVYLKELGDQLLSTGAPIPTYYMPHDLNLHTFNLNVFPTDVFQLYCPNIFGTSVQPDERNLIFRTYSYSPPQNVPTLKAYNASLAAEYPHPVVTVQLSKTLSTAGSKLLFVQVDTHPLPLTAYQAIDRTATIFNEISLASSADRMVVSGGQYVPYDYYGVGDALSASWKMAPKYPEIAAFSEANLVIAPPLAVDDNTASFVLLMRFQGSNRFYNTTGMELKLYLTSNSSSSSFSHNIALDHVEDGLYRADYSSKVSELNNLVLSQGGGSLRLTLECTQKVGRITAGTYTWPEHTITTKYPVYFESAPRATSTAYFPSTGSEQLGDVARFFYNNYQFGPESNLIHYARITMTGENTLRLPPHCNADTDTKWERMDKTGVERYVANTVRVCNGLRPHVLLAEGGALQSVTLTQKGFFPAVFEDCFRVAHFNVKQPYKANVPKFSSNPAQLVDHKPYRRADAQAADQVYFISTRPSSGTPAEESVMSFVVHVDGLLGKYFNENYVNLTYFAPELTISLITNSTTVISVASSTLEANLFRIELQHDKQPINPPFYTLHLQLAPLFSLIDDAVAAAGAKDDTFVAGDLVSMKMKLFEQQLPVEIAVNSYLLCFGTTWDPETGSCQEKCDIRMGTTRSDPTDPTNTMCACAATNLFPTQWFVAPTPTNPQGDPARCIHCPCTGKSKCVYDPQAPRAVRCQCVDGWTGLECDQPLKCPNICDARHNIKPLPSPDAATCPTECTCLKDFVVVEPLGRSTGLCECQKERTAREFYNSTYPPEAYTKQQICHYTNTHIASYSTSRCSIYFNQTNTSAQQASLVPTPTQMNKQCICRRGFAGEFCEYSAALASYTIPQNVLIMMTARNGLPLTILDGMFNFWNASQSGAALYSFNQTTGNVVLEVWLPSNTTVDIGPLPPPVPFNVQFNGLMTHDEYHHVEQQQQQEQQQYKQATKEEEYQTFSPLQTDQMTDLQKLFDEWERMQGGQVQPPSNTNPVTIVDPQCDKPLPIHYEYCNEYTTPIPVNNDETFDKEKNDDDKVKGLFAVEKENSNKMSTAIIIVIAVICGAAVFFVLLVVAIVCCRKNEVLCFAKKKKQTAKQKSDKTNTKSQDTSVTMQSGTEMSNTQSSLSPSIMPSAATSTSHTHTKPLPAGWQVQVDASTGKEYYMNLTTLESSWVHPSEAKSTTEHGW